MDVIKKTLFFRGKIQEGVLMNNENPLLGLRAYTSNFIIIALFFFKKGGDLVIKQIYLAPLPNIIWRKMIRIIVALYEKVIIEL